MVIDHQTDSKYRKVHATDHVFVKRALARVSVAT